MRCMKDRPREHVHHSTETTWPVDETRLLRISRLNPQKVQPTAPCRAVCTAESLRPEGVYCLDMGTLVELLISSERILTTSLGSANGEPGRPRPGPGRGRPGSPVWTMCNSLSKPSDRRLRCFWRTDSRSSAGIAQVAFAVDASMRPGGANRWQVLLRFG